MSGQKTNAFPCRPVGRPKISDKISGHTARVGDRTSIVSKLLLENRENGTVQDKTIQSSVMKKKYNSIPISQKPRIGINLGHS